MSYGITRTDFSRFVLPQLKQITLPTAKPLVGKVFGVVTSQNSPTQKQFEKVGGFSGLGAIFYKPYDDSKNESLIATDEFYDSCQVAFPLYPQIQNTPFLYEQVYLINLSSVATQQSGFVGGMYYISTVNIWNNDQQNSQPASNDDSGFLGPGVTENKNIRPVLPFQGDYIIKGRKGNAIRFGTTSATNRSTNEWSSVGSNNDPIMILTNGFSFNKGEAVAVEKINKDLSSIYLTSAQKIPLKTDKTGVLNNLTNPLEVSTYTYPQIIINSDRVVLNSKRDEIMIFAKTNVEINTKNVINLNANERVHLNSNAVFLGPYNENNTPQPVLLGNNTIELFQQLQRTLTSLGGYLASATSTKEGSPIPGLNAAGKEILEDMKTSIDLLNNITSKKVFTV